MREKTLTATVFAVSLIILASNAGAPGFATAYVDPIAKIQAQDEAVYASTSLEMAAHGGSLNEVLTPRFLGRYALYKPPLYYWLSAICVEFLGRTALAIRIPSILAGAATVALIFFTVRASMPLLPSLTAAILLLSSHIFFVLARTGLMDALLTFETAVAMCVLVLDPRLESRRALAFFGCASGAAIMTKALAGLFPLLGLALFCLISRSRPRLACLAQAVLITALVALPWHLWQLHAHPRWFWNEYVMTESLEKGNAAPTQTTDETHLGYYAKRLALLDPVLLIAALVGLSKKPSRAAIAFLLVILACALAFRYRNTSYLMPLYPAMAMLAAVAIPSRFLKPALALAAAIFIAKAGMPAEPWGLPFHAESQAPSEAALDRYAALHRGNDLILIQPEDQFYSSDLDLPRIRYAYIGLNADNTADNNQAPLDFRRLGITVTADEFANLHELTPLFAARLRDFDLDSTEPVATVILARDGAQIRELIAAHPETDFYIPAEFASAASHDIWSAGGPRMFLLSREKIQRP